MGKLRKIAEVLVFLVAVVFCCSCSNHLEGVSDHLEGVNEIVVEELDRMNVETTANAKIDEIILPDNLDAGANWGLKAIVCGEGGYDLYPYAGKTVTLTSVDIEGRCQDVKIKVFVVSAEDTIACAYITAREGSGMTPGVWPVNGEQCNY